jgi:hypothetical protein
MAQPHQGRSSDKLINTLGTARNANGVGISDHVRPIMTNSYSTSFVSTPTWQGFQRTLMIARLRGNCSI